MPAPFASPEDAAATDAFFAGRPEARAVWDALVEAAADWGPVEVTATKVRVCLKARTRFLYCPKVYADGRIIVRFLFPVRIESPRRRTDAWGARWSHRITLSELDDEARVWFRSACEADRDDASASVK